MDAVRGEDYTMSEAHGMSRSFGHALINLGAQRGDVVAVILPNMPEYAFIMLWASEAALRVTNLNHTSTPSKHLLKIMNDYNKCIAEEINGQLVNSESMFLVTTSDLLDKVKAASKGLDIKLIVIGENVAADCFDYKYITNNNGSHLKRYYQVAYNNKSRISNIESICFQC